MQTDSSSNLKVLIVAPSWVGDMVMAQSLFKLLKQNHPEVAIHVLAPKHLVVLIARMPEVVRVITSEFRHGAFKFCARRRLGKSLRKEEYNWAIVLPNSWKSALVPFFAKIPLRTGWRGEMRYSLLNDLRILDKNRLPLMAQRFIALGITAEDNSPASNILPSLDVIPMPRLKTTQDSIAAALQKLNLSFSAKRPVLALCIGAEYGPAKRWPAAYFAEVAQAKQAEGWDVWLFGGSKDSEVAAEVQKNCANICVDLTGKTDLAEAVDLLSLVTAVISNDSGLMHVAAALNKPLVAIYGSSSPKFTPPLSTKVAILSVDVECGPCFQRKCPHGHFACMLELKPQMVLGALDGFFV